MGSYNTPDIEQNRMFGWRVHLCTIALDQAADEAAARAWLLDHGCVILAQSSDPLEVKLVAAQSCDLCILILGPTFGLRDPLSSFSHAELEVSAAADIHPDKVLVFEQSDAEHTDSPEQCEFLRRMRDFALGTFERPYRTLDDLRAALDEALVSWRLPRSRETAAPRVVPPGAIMISSTSQLHRERAVVHAALREHAFPVIDYLHEPSEPVPPVDRVLSWARECRALVLILGADYGSISPLDGLGITELEFVTALGAQRPVLTLIRGDADTTSNEDQRQFVERVRRFVPASRILPFADNEALQRQLEAALSLFAHELAPVPLAAVPTSDQLRWYRRQVQRWLGSLPHPAQPQGMPLEQVYVSLGAGLAPSTGEARDGESRPSAAPLEVDDALARFPRLVLQGDPGAGKTVALRWCAISADHAVLPVYVRLGAYARALERGSVTSLEEYLHQEERRLVLGAWDSQGLWVPMLRTGRGVVLLDGLDEVSAATQDVIAGLTRESLRQRVVRDILAFAAQLPATTPIVIASCTLDDGGSGLVSTFTMLHMQALTPPQQRQLVLQWLHTAHPDDPLTATGTTQRVLELLQTQQRLRSWATTPLMLSLLTALVDTGGDAQARELTSKAAVLRRAVRLLLGQWGTLATREDNGPLARRRLGGRHLWPKELLLLHLAWTTFAAGRRELLTVEDVWVAWQTLPPQAQAMCAEAVVLEELSREDGFLPQVGEGEYTFYHPIFQEYLAAAWIAAVSAQERESQIARKRLSAGWEETTQLLVGELDRLRCAGDTDVVVRTLIVADRQPLPARLWSDPLHLSLRRAARAHGGRVGVNTHSQLGDLLAEAWS